MGTIWPVIREITPIKCIVLESNRECTCINLFRNDDLDMTFTGYHHDHYRKSYPAIETEGAKLQREQEPQFQFRKSYSMKLAMKQEDEGDWWKNISIVLP